MSNPLAASASGTQANAPAGNSIAEVIDAFWVKQQLDMLEIDGSHDWRFHQLPLARIKKVMKLDDDAKNMMISAEVPILFAKACEFFILELTLRSWVHTEENKRRTLQKSDVAAALSRLDMYDFLIDIVPREDSSTHPSAAAAAGVSPLRGGMAAQQLGEGEDDEEYNPTE